MFNVGVIEAAATLDDSDYRSKLQAMPGMAKAAMGKIAALAAGFLSFGALAAGIKDSIKLFTVQENAVNGVAAALRNQERNMAAQQGQMDSYAGAVRRGADATRRAADNTRQVIGQSTQMTTAFGGMRNNLRAATIAAAGLAAVYGGDMGQNMRDAAKAGDDHAKSMVRDSAAMAQATVAGKQFNDQMRHGADAMNGMVSGEKQVVGQAARVTTAFGGMRNNLRAATIAAAGLTALYAGGIDQSMRLVAGAGDEQAKSMTRYRSAVVLATAASGRFNAQARNGADAMKRVDAGAAQADARYKRLVDDLAEYAGELQKATVYGDETILQAMSLGMNMGIQGGQIKQAAKAAIGLAAAYNLDLNTSMKLIAKANSGSTAALQHYGITLDKTKSQTEQFNELLKKGADSFALAEAQAQTTGGRIQQMSNAWGDLKETIGEFIVNLFDVGEATGGITDMMVDLSATIKKNMNEWVYETRKVYYNVEAFAKETWALLEPMLKLLKELCINGLKDILAIGVWTYENFNTLWSSLPDIFAGVGRDILQYWRNIFDTLVNLAVNLGKAIWQAIKGEGTAGFKVMADQLVNDAISVVADVGRETEAALQKAGVSPFPEMKGGDWQGMVDQYKQLGKEWERIEADRIAKQAKLEEDYAKKLWESKRGGSGQFAKQPIQEEGGPAKNSRESVAGSFSAAILSAMLGSGSPEKETAANTKELVRELKKTNAKITDGMEEVYT